jgi:hypothetical protein
MSTVTPYDQEQDSRIKKLEDKVFGTTPGPTPTPPTPEPGDCGPAPTEGTVKPGGWGGNPDPNTWEITTMRDNATMWKVVDAQQRNVATHFSTEANAKYYVKYWKCKDEKDPVPECGPGEVYDTVKKQCVPAPTPGPGPVEGDVKMLYNSTGRGATFTYKSSNPGRHQQVANLPACFLNLEVTGYFFIKKVSNMGEELSIKTRGGGHSGSAPKEGSCYIQGISFDGTPNCQYESPHPNNHPMPGAKVVTQKPLGSNIVGKWFGIKNVVFQQGDHDHLETWIDTGGIKADGKPANTWVKFFEVDSKQFFGKCNGGGDEKVFFRIDDVAGDPRTGVDAKFMSVREITAPGA